MRFQLVAVAWGWGRARGAASFACALLWAWAAGCTPAQYAGQADKSAQQVIAEKQRLALGSSGRPFEIAYRPFAAASQATTTTAPATASSPATASAPATMAATAATTAPATTGDLLDGSPIPLSGQPRILNLDQCLRIAARNSRTFQTRKEQLYIAALDLANRRHHWSLLSGDLTASGGYVHTADGSTVWSGAAAANASFAQQFADGGLLTLGLGLNLATDFLGARGTTVGSLVSANFTQPLLRGGWRGFAYEPLYRAERDLAIAILSYQRYTQAFAVDIATSYYRVLQRRDQLTNDENNLRRLDLTARFIGAQVDAGMMSRVQLDQAQQDVLNARARIETSRQAYQDSLDQFKFTLGLPIAALLELDSNDLAALTPMPAPMDMAQAEQVALRTRPDVLTAYAVLRDARRDVEIAADQFNPQLNLSAGASLAGTPPRKPLRFNAENVTHNATLDFEYQLDQTDNRDNYRKKLLAADQAARGLDEFLDQVRLDVHQSYRALMQSSKTYTIQKAAVTLAVRRTKLVELEQREGLVSTRDVLEAEDALRTSRNAFTAALVDYASTRLRFLSTLGMISVDAQGRFHERDVPSYIDNFRGDSPK